jgi:hypothetical protein
LCKATRKETSYSKIYVDHLQKSIDWYIEQLGFQLRFMENELAIIESEKGYILILICDCYFSQKNNSLFFKDISFKQHKMKVNLTPTKETVELFDPSGNRINIVT